MKTNNKYKDLKIGQVVWLDEGLMIVEDRPVYTEMIVDSIYHEKSEDLENPKLIHKGYVYCHPIDDLKSPYKLYFDELILENPNPTIERNEKEMARQHIEKLENEIRELKTRYEL